MSVPKRKQLSKATRLEVLNKYDNHCAYCGCELTYEQLNVDHKIPLYYAEFGYDINYLESMDNYMPSCRSCNKYKTTYTIETFRKMIEKQPDILNRDSSTYRLATKFGVVTPTPHKVKFYFEKVEENLKYSFDTIPIVYGKCPLQTQLKYLKHKRSDKNAIINSVYNKHRVCNRIYYNESV